MSLIGGRYRRLRTIDTPLNRTGRVGYATDSGGHLTGTLGEGYSSSVASPAATPRKSRATGTPAASLPPWIDNPESLWPASESDWPGCVCVARFRSSAAPLVTELLARERVSWWLPQERVRREYRRPGGGTDRQTYTRAILPGLLIVGDGIRGHEYARLIGSRYGNTVFGFVEVSAPNAARFREQLLSLAALLTDERALTVVRGFVPGRRVRVVSGFARGAVGVLVEDRGGHRFAVNLPLLGRAVETEIDIESLEPADDDPPAA